MRKILTLLWLFASSLIASTAFAQCYTPTGGTVCSSTGTLTNYGTFSAKYSWDSIKVSQNVTLTVKDSGLTSNNSDYMVLEIYTECPKNVQLWLKYGTQAFSKFNLDNYTFNGQAGNEHVYFACYKNPTTLQLIRDSCGVNIADTGTIRIRKICQFSNLLTSFGNKEWIENIFKWKNPSISTAFNDYLGSGTNQPLNFTHNVGSGAPILQNNCTICPSASSNDSFAFEYRMDTILPRGFYQIICNTPNDLTLSCKGGGSEIFNYWTNGSSKSTKTANRLIRPSTNGGKPGDLYAITTTGKWLYQLKTDTGSITANFSICKMDGDYTWGNNKWNAYVYDYNNPVYDGYGYQGTFASDSATFAYSWPTQPTLNNYTCGVTMDDSSYLVTFLMRKNFQPGRYKVRVKSQQGGQCFLSDSNGVVKYYISNTGIASSYDVTSPFITFSGDTFFTATVYKYTTSTAKLSFVSCREPKDPGHITVSRDTACVGDQVTLTADTADGTETQWYKKSCAGAGGLYIGSGASITVTMDTSTTFYVRNRNRAYASGDTTNSLDLYSVNCSSKRIIAVPYPSAPTAPTAQSRCSSGSEIFTFSGVNAGTNGNQVQWATNSIFTNCKTITSGGNFNDTVANGHIDTIWLRSKRSDGGCVSSAVTTTAANYANPAPPTAPPSQSVCSDTAYTFVFDSIQVGQGGDSIEWALSSTFTSNHLIGHYGNISITRSSGVKDTVLLRSKVTTTGCLSSTVFTTVVSNPHPAPPPTPVPQSTCSDTTTFFVFDSVSTGSGGDQIAWALERYFLVDSVINNYGRIGLWVNVAHEDSLWLQSVISSSECRSEAIFTTVKNNLNPGNPYNISPQWKVGDSSTMFSFDSIVAYLGADRIEWAFDSAFTSLQSVSIPATISLLMPPNADSTLWIRSIDTATGCISHAYCTIAILTSTITDTGHYVGLDTFVCRGNSLSIPISDSEIGIKYFLRNDTVITDSLLGTGSIIHLNTGNIDTLSVFNIIAIDTSNFSFYYVDSSIIIDVFDAVDTPAFVVFDTLVLAGDTSCFIAAADNTTGVRYYILSGGAQIDSLTGKLSSVTSSFVVQAIAGGLNNCSGPKTKNLNVRVTDVGIPIASLFKRVLVDTMMPVTITTDSIFAGANGDEIEWSFDQQFTSSSVFTSPGTISVELMTGSDTIIYARTVDSRRGHKSKVIFISLSADGESLSAGLLDKSGWELRDHDEFSYSAVNQNIAYTDDVFPGAGSPLWSLNGRNSFYVPENSTAHNAYFNHMPWQDQCYYNTGDDENGSGKEIYFENGLAHITTTLYPGATPGGNGVQVSFQDVHQGNATKHHTHWYKSGTLCTRNPIDLTGRPGLFEIRCKLPSQDNSYPGFFLMGGEADPFFHDTEIDIIDGAGPTHVRTGMVDWTKKDPHPEGTDGGCSKQVNKFTPCNFQQDWHTYSVMVSEQKIVVFIDGKEAWSHSVDPSDPWPAVLPFAPYVYIGHSATAFGYGTYDFQVDYFRVYEPKPTNSSNPPQCFQNLNNGAAKTLDATSTLNNSWATVPSKMSNTTVEIASDCNLAVSLDGSILYKGDLPKPSFLGGGICYKWKNSIETKIDAYYYYKDKFGTWNNSHLIKHDLKDFITPSKTNSDIYYYRTGRSELMVCDMATNIKFRAMADKQYNKPINNCAGFIQIDDLDRVWFKSTKNNLCAWSYQSGLGNWKLSSIFLNHSNSTTATTVHSCGCLAFYTDVDHNLRQLYWSGGVWTELPATVANIYEMVGGSNTHVNIKSELLLDESKERVYFIGDNNALYYYIYKYNSASGINPVKVSDGGVDSRNSASLCADYYNVKSGISFNGNKDIIYYRGTDDRVWYFFTDKEASFDNQHLNNPVARENWNKSTINYAKEVQGALCLEPDLFGRLFYVGADKKLFKVDWQDADYSLACPYPVQTNVIVYKTSESDTLYHGDYEADSFSSDILLTVSPNPSNNTFGIRATNVPSGNFQIEITSLIGVVEFLQSGVTIDGNVQQKWDSDSRPAGVYILRIITATGEIIKKKLVKE